jgi:hypothetical protein
MLANPLSDDSIPDDAKTRRWHHRGLWKNLSCCGKTAFLAFWHA